MALERGLSLARAPKMHRHGVVRRASDRPRTEVDTEVLFGEPTRRVADRHGLGRHREALILQVLAGSGAAVGGVADDLGLGLVVGVAGD